MDLTNGLMEVKKSRNRFSKEIKTKEKTKEVKARPVIITYGIVRKTNESKNANPTVTPFGVLFSGTLSR